MENLNFEIEGNNKFLELLQEAIPALKEIKKQTSEVKNEEKQLGETMLKNLKANEEHLAKEAAARAKQAKAVEDATKFQMQLAKAHDVTAEEAHEAMKVITESAEELTELGDQLQAAFARVPELIRSTIASIEEGDLDGVQKIIDDFILSLDPAHASVFADIIDKELTKASNSLTKYRTELERLSDEADKSEIATLSGEEKLRAQLDFENKSLDARKEHFAEILENTSLFTEDRIRLEELAEEDILRLRRSAIDKYLQEGKKMAMGLFDNGQADAAKELVRNLQEGLDPKIASDFAEEMAAAFEQGFSKSSEILAKFNIELAKLSDDAAKKEIAGLSGEEKLRAQLDYENSSYEMRRAHLQTILKEAELSSSELIELEKATEAEITKLKEAATAKYLQEGKKMALSLFDGGNEQAARELAKNLQEGLDPKIAKAFSVEMEDAFSKVEKAVSRPARELKELKRQLAAGELEGEAFQQATLRAAALADEIGDVNARIAFLSSDTFAMEAVIDGFEGLAAGAALVQGALGLLGNENEDLQKGLLKIQSIMAVLSGLQAVQAKILDESRVKTAALIAVQKVYTFVMAGSTKGLQLFRAALVATGIGAVVVGLGLLIANFDKLQNLFRDTVNPATVEFAETTRLAAEESLDAVDAFDLQERGLRLLGRTEEEITEKRKERLRIAKADLDVAVKAQAIYVNELKHMKTKKSLLDEEIAKLNELKEQRSDLTYTLLELDEEEKNKFEEAEEEYARNREERLKEEAEKRKQALAKKKQEDEKQLQLQKTFNESLLKLYDDQDKDYIAGLSGEDKILAQAAANDDLIELTRQGLTSQLALLDISAQERATKEAAIEELIKQQRADNIRNTEVELAALRAEEAAKSVAQNEHTLKLQEQILLDSTEAEFNIRKSAFENEEEFIATKEEALLNIRLRFAQQNMQLLQGELSLEQQATKAALQKTITEIENQLKGLKDKVEKKQESKVDSFLINYLGIKPDQVKTVKDGFKDMLGEFANFLSAINEIQLQEAEKRTAAIEEEIEAQEDKLKREKELMDEGLANSVTSEEERLKQLNDRRKASIAEEEKIRRRQARLETAQQAGSLITASANIYKALSPAGPFGIAIAVATIAAMLGTFAATKIKAAKASEEIQLRHGGTWDGKRLKQVKGRTHEQGGHTLLSQVTVEDGEGVGVLSREAMLKYGSEFMEAVQKWNSGKSATKVIPLPVLTNAMNNRYSNAIKTDNDNEELIRMRKALEKMENELSGFKKRENNKETTSVHGNTIVTTKGAHKKTIKLVA